MSLERIEQHIKELEAVKNYDKVKNERDLLLKKVEELEKSLLNERKRVEELLQVRKNLEDQVKVRDGEIESLKNELKVKEKLIAELKETQRKLEFRVNELEKLKTLAEGKTLKEAEEAFLKAMEGKINEEVSKRVNEEFLKRVEESSERKAREKLERLISVEWPKWFKENVMPRVYDLEYKIGSNAIALLKGPWVIVCDKCGTTFRKELTEDDIEMLFREGVTFIKCENPNCKDFLGGRHSIRISLKDLILSYITVK